MMLCVWCTLSSDYSNQQQQNPRLIEELKTQIENVEMQHETIVKAMQDKYDYLIQKHQESEEKSARLIEELKMQLYKTENLLEVKTDAYIQLEKENSDKITELPENETFDDEREVVDLQNEITDADRDDQKMPVDEDKYPKALYENMDWEKNIHICITGMAGSGKSMFVNTFRGIDRNNNADDKELAVSESHQSGISYAKPYGVNLKNAEVTLWDLPGYGTEEFSTKNQNYIKKIGSLWSHCDLVLVFTSHRIWEGDTDIIQQLKDMGIDYLVHLYARQVPILIF